MEVSTMSPPAISPTEGDDLCETDVINVAIHSVTLLICLCGLAGNGAVLWVLQPKSCNSKIFDVAVVDFLFLLLTVPSTLLSLVEDMSCSPIVPLLYLNLLFQLSVVSWYWGLYWLMPSNPVYYMDKLFQLCCRCKLPLRMFWVVDSVQRWAFFALFTLLPTVIFLCPSHEQGHCRAAFISMYAIILLFFVAPMVIFITINIIKAKCGSQQPQPKRRDIVIVLTVLLTLLLIIWNFLQQLGYILVPSQAVFLLTCITSSIKPFICFLVGSWKRDFSMGSCWRHCSMESCRRHCSMQSLRKALQRVFEGPKENTACGNDPTMDTEV
ncbi:mas-related G-protein coupled receptor member H-like isoform X2 [Anomalospiza imberbis]|uniref:mas-related G-protein coupled receptor member H-like isoform X2 n=1 Tax=Anomalospiza imberbis TaxID=187417 RepID=UPI00358E6444